MSRQPPEALTGFVAQPLTAERRAQLARQWRDLLAENALLRRRRDGAVQAGYAERRVRLA